jgi:diacylglycerol kinase (ATP)
MWAIVINPVSGGGKGATLGEEVARYFASNSLSYQVITSTSAKKWQTILMEFIELQGDTCQGVVAVGGDGLAHLVMQLVVPRSIPFTVIPAGTGNDFVRALGWSLLSFTKQLDCVTTEPPKRIDLGVVDSEWFGAILSTGFDSVVNEKANRMNWPRGPMKYNVAIALELPKFKPMQYTIGLDDKIIETEAMLIAVANGSSYGAGMLVCPDARMDDGLFDVMILRPVSKIEFIKVFPKVFKGSHIDHPKVDIYRSKCVSLTAPAIAYADGERVGTLPVQAECIAGAGLSWTP